MSKSTWWHLLILNSKQCSITPLCKLPSSFTFFTDTCMWTKRGRSWSNNVITWAWPRPQEFQEEVNGYHTPRSGYCCYATVSHIQPETTYPIVAMFVEWHTDMTPRYFSLLYDIYNAPGRNSHNHNTCIMVLYQYIVLQLPDIIQPQFQSWNQFTKSKDTSCIQTQTIYSDLSSQLPRFWMVYRHNAMLGQFVLWHLQCTT